MLFRTTLSDFRKYKFMLLPVCLHFVMPSVTAVRSRKDFLCIPFGCPLRHYQACLSDIKYNNTYRNSNHGVGYSILSTRYRDSAINIH